MEKASLTTKQKGKETYKLLKEYTKKREAIYNKAVIDGSWSNDSEENKLLFKDLEKEYKEKLDEIDTGDDEKNNKDHNLLWRWCLIGNIVDENLYGFDEQIKHGTKYFKPGTKVYIAPPSFRSGNERVWVIGMSNYRHRYICVLMKNSLIDKESLRVKKIYSPSILNLMNQKEKHEYHCGWWGNEDDDLRLILEFVAWGNVENAEAAIKKYGIEPLKKRTNLDWTFREKPKDEDIVHIVFSSTAVDELKSIYGVDAKILWFPENLEYGNISKVGDYKTRKDDNVYLNKYQYEGSPEEFDFFIKDTLRFYKKIEKYDTSNEFYIYASNKNSHEYCGLLYMCYLLKNYNISVINLPFGYKRTEEYIAHLKKNKNTLRFKRLNSHKKEQYIEEWKEIKSENANLRVLKIRKLKGFKYSDYYDLVKSYYTDDAEDYMKVIGKILENDKTLTYYQLLIISNKMIDEGVLKIVEVKPKETCLFHNSVYVKRSI